LRQLLYFVKHLFGYFGYGRYFSLDEVKIEDAGHDLPLHLPILTFGEEESIACDKLERSNDHIIGGFFVVSLVVLFVELSDKLWINQCDDHIILDKVEEHLVVPESEFERVKAISVLLTV